MPLTPRQRRARRLLEKDEDLRRTAMKIIREEGMEQRQKNQERINGQKCECSHRHDEHGMAYSINYSAGFCKKCECRRFLTR